MDASSTAQGRFPSTFQCALAGLAALVSAVPASHIGVGWAIVSCRSGRPAVRPPPDSLGWIFIAVGAAKVLVAACCVALVVVAGRFLARRRRWAFCVVVAAVSCAFFQFGTVRGVFGVIVPSRPDPRAAFARQRPPLARPTPLEPFH